MASFTYSDWKAQSAAKAENNSVNKVGFFKLSNSGDEALVRFDIASLEDLIFATLHRVKKNADDRFPSMSISCLNPLGETGKCPLCKAVEDGDPRVQKATKRVFVKMLVAYKGTDGKFASAVPVIWERPAGFATEIAAFLKDYGDLTQHLFKITRTGTALDTRYNVNYAVPTIFKPEMIPADFTAFNDFKIAKHSYWEKTVDECNEYIRTGAFPEVAKTTTATATATPVAPTAEAPKAAPVVENVAPTVAPAAPAATTSASTGTTTKFSGFNF